MGRRRRRSRITSSSSPRAWSPARSSRRTSAPSGAAGGCSTTAPARAEPSSRRRTRRAAAGQAARGRALALSWRPRTSRCASRSTGTAARRSTSSAWARATAPSSTSVGRMVQLGADRRYTGPDCPPEMLAEGGIPQGDCAPMPWLLSSRGYGVLAQTFANGTRFDLSGDRLSVSTRALAGPLRARAHVPVTPAARLRALCRQTGFPSLLPEWGYGFWKSRDVYEHQRRRARRLRRVQASTDPARRDRDRLAMGDAIQLLGVQPASAPRCGGDDPRAPRRGVRTVCGAPRGSTSTRAMVRSRPSPSPTGCTASPRRTTSRAPKPGTSSRTGQDRPWVGQWWMGTGSIVDFTSPAAEEWWRDQVKQRAEAGSRGHQDGRRRRLLPEGRRPPVRRSAGGEAAWELGGMHRISLQRALDEVHPGQGVVFGRSGWIGQHALGHTWAGDQASDFWSLRALVVATLSAAASGFSNWSHDVGGYLGHRLVERCPPELFVRWLQFGCFTPLMQAHSRFPHEPWNYGERMVDLYRAYVLLHEQLVPYARAAADTAARPVTDHPAALPD